jgi:uncharacterized membrane protein YgdD (TMEM256/DUF423 family)
MKPNQWIRVGALFCVIAVAAGAFGAHALKNYLTDYQLEIWNKAVQYQFIHAIGICICGLMALHSPESAVSKAAWLFVAGIICFSGSLYILSTPALHGMNVNWAGPVTPLGGMCFIAGWIMLALNGVKSKREN